MNHDNYQCLINNNKCKKACRKMVICQLSVREEEIWRQIEKEFKINDREN